MPTTKSYLCRPLALVVLAAAALAASVVLAAFVLASPARAEGYLVTNTNDSGDGSLRDAIGQANTNPGEDTILFNVGDPATIILDSRLPLITDSSGLSIDGANKSITISGNSKWRVFEVARTGKLALNKLTVARGHSYDSSGGAIRNEGSLVIDNSTISNSANGPAGGFNTCGGGLYNAGTAKVSNSTFSGNTDVGILGFGGGICNGGDLTVTNSTISGNNSGGLQIDFKRGLNATTTLKNTLLANNPPWDSPVPQHNCSMATSDKIDGGYNIESGNSCNFSTANHSLKDTNPLLGPLSDNGGPTKTHALLPGSPAINAGNNDFAVNTKGFRLTYDQRGPGFPRISGGVVDMGAYELTLPGSPPPTSTTPESRQDCQKGGWKNFEDASGKRLFKNQGQCIKAVKEAQR